MAVWFQFLHFTTEGVMSAQKLYQRIAATLAAIENCKRMDNTMWLERHRDSLDELMKHMPSGSGFDCGTKLADTSTFEKLIFETSFHHMDESGGYDGWTEHAVTVIPSLLHGFTTRISGRNRNGIKDYIGEVFEQVLSEIAP
jgi:hypothetical protein